MKNRLHLRQPKFLLLKKILVFSVLALAVVLTALAYPSGKTGHTSMTSDGCYCHGSSSNSNTQLSITDNPTDFTVNQSSTNSFQITVSHSSLSAAGIDIGVKTSETNETNAGTLTPASGSGLKVQDNELTHTQPKSFSSGTVDFDFTWTAPSAHGTYYLRAISNAVNRNNSTSGDQWNWMTPQTVTVAGFTLASPTSGQSWCPGTSHDIEWTSTGILNVKIELSDDGGSTWGETLQASVSAASESWTWNIPANHSSGSQFRIRVADVSDATRKEVSTNFSIPAQTEITSQPVDKDACTGQQVQLSVAAAGGNLSYSWRKNGQAISGASTSTYTIASPTLNDAGSYDCVINGACGDPVTSEEAILSVTESPSISANPESQAVCVGASVSFNVTASGQNIEYQWKKDGQDISGANTPTYSINNAEESDEGSYEVVVSGVCNPAKTSTKATLTVNDPPKITTQPENMIVCEGQETILMITAEGSELEYQWRKDGNNISGATNSSYTLAEASKYDAGDYDVFVRGFCNPSLSSRIMRLSVNPKPFISTQPENKSVVESSNIDLFVIASGGKLSFQWQKNTVDIEGETASILKLLNVKVTDSGIYTCLVTNDCAVEISEEANVIVTSAGSGPLLSLSQSTVEFGMVAPGESKEIILDDVIRNSGDEMLEIISMDIIGASKGNFEIIEGNAPVSLENDETHSFTIRFSPDQNGQLNAKLLFTSNSNVNPELILTGTGGTSEVSVSAESIDFGTIEINNTVEKSVVISNLGSNDEKITSIDIGGNQMNHFEFADPGFPLTLMPSENHELVINYSPDSDGISEALLNIHFENNEMPLTVVLSGMGIITSVFEDYPLINDFVAFPNPAENNVSMKFNFERSLSYELIIFDIYGNTVKYINGRASMRGDHTVKWDGKDTNGNQSTSGVYRAVLSAEGVSSSFNILIVR